MKCFHCQYQAQFRLLIRRMKNWHDVQLNYLCCVINDQVSESTDKIWMIFDDDIWLKRAKRNFIELLMHPILRCHQIGLILDILIDHCLKHENETSSFSSENPEMISKKTPFFTPLRITCHRRFSLYSTLPVISLKNFFATPNCSQCPARERRWFSFFVCSYSTKQMIQVLSEAQTSIKIVAKLTCNCVL